MDRGRRKDRRSEPVSDYRQWDEYKEWQRQRDAERQAKEDSRYAEIDAAIDDYFAKKWRGAEPVKMYDKTGKATWVWSEKPPLRRLDQYGKRRIDLPQHVKADTRQVPDTLRELVEGSK